MTCWSRAVPPAYVENFSSFKPCYFQVFVVVVLSFLGTVRFCLVTFYLGFLQWEGTVLFFHSNVHSCFNALKYIKNISTHSILWKNLHKMEWCVSRKCSWTHSWNHLDLMLFLLRKLFTIEWLDSFNTSFLISAISMHF